MRRQLRRAVDGLREQPRPSNLGTTQFNGARIERMPNGDIEVSAGDEGPRIPEKGDFDENLAEYLSDNQRQNIAQELLEEFEADKESRKDWELREETAVAMLGIPKQAAESPDEPKKLEFPQSQRHEVTHPLIAEAATQFNARAIAEIFPPEGPVRATILGVNRTNRLMDQALRIETFMNYYLTEVDREYFDDVDSMLFYLALSGSAFKKVAIDVRTGLPISRYVKAKNFVVPYTARSLSTAARFHHQYNMVESDFAKAVRLGYYLDNGSTTPGFGLEAANKAEDRADFRKPSVPREEIVYDIVESHALYTLPLKYRWNRDDRNQVRPYVFHIDRENVEITRISRGWAEHDRNYRRKLGFVHYKFLPGLGFYGFGYPHLIGSLGKAASGAVNALLDGATAANFQGGFKTKSASGTGDVELEYGVYKEVDSDAEDLTKSFFNPPFQGPEPAMFQLLGALVESGRRFASITDTQVGAGDNKGPVGTTVALIEEGSRVYTAIHKRLHKSQRDEFSILADLIHEYMPAKYPYETKGEQQQLLRTDFDGRVDIAPVSDPNIFSSTQRLAIAQNVIALQKQDPDLYDRGKRIEAHRIFLQALRVPDWEAIAPEEKRPNYQDPVTENMMMLVGQGVKAFYHQLDQVHIAAHQNFLQIQQAMMDPKEFAQLAATIQAHCREHMANAYRKEVERRLGIPLPPIDLDGGEQQDLPAELEAAISVAVAQHLLPPPPNPEEQAATQEVMDEKARKDAETIAGIERDTAAWEAEQRRLQEAHDLELRFKEEEHQQDLEHEAQATRENLIRGRAEAAAGILRDNVKGAMEMQRKGVAAQQEFQHRDAKGRQELSHKDRAGRQDLEHKGRVSNLDLASKGARALQDVGNNARKFEQESRNRQRTADQEHSNRGRTADQDLSIRERGAQQDQRIKDAGAEQDLRIKDQGAKQQRRQVAAKGQQERGQSRETHRENLRQGTEKHTAEMRRMDQKGEQDLRSRERRAELDEKIASKRALGRKDGGKKAKAKR